MMVSQFLPVFFKLLNFSVFATAAVWAIKRYMIPAIKERMQQEHADEQGLQDEVVLYAERADACADELSHQKKQCAETLQKVNIWLQVVEKEREKEAREQAVLRAQIVRTKEQQARTRVWQQQMDELMPRIVASARQELAAKCATPECQKRYLERIFQHVKKS